MLVPASNYFLEMLVTAPVNGHNLKWVSMDTGLRQPMHPTRRSNQLKQQDFSGSGVVMLELLAPNGNSPSPTEYGTLLVDEKFRKIAAFWCNARILICHKYCNGN